MAAVQHHAVETGLHRQALRADERVDDLLLGGRGAVFGCRAPVRRVGRAVLPWRGAGRTELTGARGAAGLWHPDRSGTVGDDGRDSTVDMSGDVTVDLSIDTVDGTAEAFVSGPETAGHDLPGVLLFPDIFGLRPQIRTMTDRIASWGYVVLAPNVFYRSGTVDDLAPTVDLREPVQRDGYIATVCPLMEGLTSDLSRPDATAYLDVLLALPGVAAHAGVIGYCMGARLALRAGGDHPDLSLIHI